MILFGIALGASTIARAENVSPAKAAELGLHRIERLVTLHKIDESYVNFFYSIGVQKLSPAQPADPAFKVSGLQAPSLDGKNNEVDIMMDATGKALSNSVKEGFSPANPPRWAEKDALSLGENSFHYVIDNAPTKPELKPFNLSFSNMVLTQMQNAQGQTVSRATFRSTESAQVLDVILNLDGSFASANVHNP